MNILAYIYGYDRIRHAVYINKHCIVMHNLVIILFAYGCFLCRNTANNGTGTAEQKAADNCAFTMFPVLTLVSNETVPC